MGSSRGDVMTEGSAREGDVLDVSAPRGSFTLRPGENPVVLLSAGVGATPVISMLHALAREGSQRQVWWIYGARDRSSHPFVEESRFLLEELSRGRSYVVYSRPAATDQVEADFDAPGHIPSIAFHSNRIRLRSSSTGASG